MGANLEPKDQAVARDQYTSNVIDYVRRYPQVVSSTIEVENGNSHRKLRFMLNGGQRMTVTLNAPGNPNHGGDAAAKLQDVRRLLGGPPPDNVEKKVTNIVELKAKAPDAEGKISLYNDGKLRFTIPSAILPIGTKLHVDRLDKELWSIKRSDVGKSVACKSNNTGMVTVSSPCSGLEPFGIHPMDIALVDGAVLVSPRSGNRPPVSPHQYKSKARSVLAKAAASFSDDASPSPTVPEVTKRSECPAPESVPAVAVIGADEMRRRLELIREVERMTTYRMVVRVSPDGERRIAFEAPKIE